MKRTFKHVWMQMKLFTILYQVIKIVILIAVKIEELESRSECGCPLPPWVTQSSHRINTPYPKVTEPSKVNEVNSAQGLAQGIRSQASSADTVLSSCLYRGCWETGIGTGWGEGSRDWQPLQGRVTRIRKRRKKPKGCYVKGGQPDGRRSDKALLHLLQQVGDGALALASLRTDHWRQSQMFPGRAAPASTAACLSRLQPRLQPGHAQPDWALGLELSWKMTVSLPAPWAPSHSTRAMEGTMSGGAGGLEKDFLEAKLV